MLEVIEKLLVVQDRDRQILKIEDRLAHIPPERSQMESRLAAANAALESVRHKLMQLESDRKKLEIEVDTQKGHIERYSLQQFQTRKNEEYRALTHEIDICKQAISKSEDQQLELMEQADVAQKELQTASRAAVDTKKMVEARMAELALQEKNLRNELAELQKNRAELISAVDEPVRVRYERLLRHRGNSVIVGIQHGVCGGCHMLLNRQVVVSCRAEQEILNCPNCGRILYYTPDMDVAVVE